MAREESQHSGSKAIERIEDQSLAELEEFDVVELEERLEFTALMTEADVACKNGNCSTGNCGCPPSGTT